MPPARRRYQFPQSVRLTLWFANQPGIARVRAGKAFRYTLRGKVVRHEQTLARIRSLAVPPAWERVLICPHPNGHIQAVGYDAKGRKQYRYHPAFRAKREGAKYAKLSAFGRALPRIRERVDADLGLPGLTKAKVLAAVVDLLDRTHLRVGNGEYARANGSFGLSTLLDQHVTCGRRAVRLRFRGKSGVTHERVVTDARLARVVRSCRDLPGQHLFQYRDADGRVRRIGSADVNGYIRQAAGQEFTAKDFRTWAGTVKAAAELAKLPRPETKTATERAVVGVIKTVAAALGNTPAVCRKSYIHPRVIEAFAAGGFPTARAAGGLSADERRVLKLLNGSRSATRATG
jgi:DNA topoisomerase-1